MFPQPRLDLPQMPVFNVPISGTSLEPVVTALGVAEIHTTGPASAGFGPGGLSTDEVARAVAVVDAEDAEAALAAVRACVPNGNDCLVGRPEPASP